MATNSSPLSECKPPKYCVCHTLTSGELKKKKVFSKDNMPYKRRQTLRSESSAAYHTPITSVTFTAHKKHQCWRECK